MPGGVRQWLWAFVLAVLAATHLAVGRWAWTAATARQEARAAAQAADLTNDLAKVSERARRLQGELTAAQEARAALVEALEHEAASDPAAALRVPSDDSLRRLRRRWGED